MTPLKLAVLSGALAAALATGCAGSAASREDFEADVQSSRDRVDTALAQVTDARTFKDLVERLRVAAVDIASAAEDLADADAPDDLRDERDSLAESYRLLANEVNATADSLGQVDKEGIIQGLNFENWNRVQRDLAALRRQQIDVRPLDRH